MSRGTLVALLAFAAAFILYSVPPPPLAYASDDDDSGDGADCYPETGDCDDQVTLSDPIDPVEFSELCPNGTVDVEGKASDYTCWDPHCEGECYRFTLAPADVVILEAVW